MATWEFRGYSLLAVLALDVLFVVVLACRAYKAQMAAVNEDRVEREKALTDIMSKYVRRWLDAEHGTYLEREAKKATISEARRLNRKAMVRKWVRAMGLDPRKMCLKERLAKVVEESVELETAIIFYDKKAIADAVADMQYVLETIPMILGYDGDAAFKAVHDSNMTKDSSIFKIDGKGKGGKFAPPDFSKVKGLK